MTNFSKSTQLEISKATGQFDFISRSYDLSVWSDDTDRQRWKHDLCVMREFRDLKCVTLQLLGQHKTMLFEMRIAFGDGPSPAGFVIDSAQGVELPVLDRNDIHGHRIIIQQNNRESQYRHLLKINWSPAESLKRAAGREYNSEHVSCISGGRLEGTFHVHSGARHQLRITSAGGRGFAFASSAAGDRFQDIFCHQRFAPDGFVFSPGQCVTATIVQTPRGLQARSIEAAA